MVSLINSVKENMKKLMTIACVALAPCFVVSAVADTVLNIQAQSKIQLNPLYTLAWEPSIKYLDAGSYTLTPVNPQSHPDALFSAWAIGTYQGQNKWSSVYELAVCRNLANCDGSVNSNYDVTSWGTSVNILNGYDTAAAAFAVAQVGSFTLAAAQDVYFGFYDSNFTDNSGGVSLLLSKVNPVPEPQTYAMVLAGLALLGWRSYRNKSTSGV
jgi:hypothetical protein